MMYQNQPQFSTSQAILANNENFNLVNYSRNNLAQPVRTMPSCTCCNLNQYPVNSYYYPRHLKVKHEERQLNIMNKKQMNMTESEIKKFNNPPSRLEKAKQFVRKVESESMASSSPASGDLAQVQNQYYPVDVLYTLLPMYLTPVLNRQAYQSQQPIDPAYIQSLVNYFLNMHRQIQAKPLNNNQQQPSKSNNISTNNQNKTVAPKKPNRSRILIQDIDSKVDEHFKRSLGNDYANLMSDSKRIKLDNDKNSTRHSLEPFSPNSSIKTTSSCSSPNMNLNETSNHSLISEKSPEFVESHFSKALGADMWNRLKEKILHDNGSDGSSTVSSMSDTSISPVKL